MTDRENLTDEENEELDQQMAIEGITLVMPELIEWLRANGMLADLERLYSDPPPRPDSLPAKPSRGLMQRIRGLE